MALSLFRLYKSGEDIYHPAVAAAPSGGIFVAHQGSAGLDLARVSSSGTFAWQKTLTYAGAAGAPCAIASNSTHFVVGMPYHVSSVYHIDVSMYDAAGTLVWQTTVPLSTVSADLPQTSLSITSTGDVLVVAKNPAQTRIDLLYLNAIDGSIAWATNVRSSTGGVYEGRFKFLSDGTIAHFVRTDSTYYLQKLSGTDGAVIWSRALSGVTVGDLYGLAVDASDNIYAWGTEVSGTNGPELPVIKVNSSGTLVWSRRVRSATSQTNPISFSASSEGMANGSGVYIPCRFVFSSVSHPGFLFVPEDGSTNSKLTQYAGSDIYEHRGSSTLTSAQYTGFIETAPSFFEALLLLDAQGSADDGTYGTYARTTSEFSTASDSITLFSSEYLRGAAAGVSADTNITPSSSAGSLLLEAIEVNTTYVASAASPQTVFGAPVLNLQLYATGGTSTAFGTPVSTIVASGVGSSLVFGTPAFEPDTVRAADSIIPTTRFGDVFAYGGIAPPPHVAESTSSALRFGETTALIKFDATAASDEPRTMFGAATARITVPASALSSSAVLGVPTVFLRRRADSTGRATQFGLPSLLNTHTASSLFRTRFGTPAAAWYATSAASGFCGTLFGAPSAMRAQQRTRSAVFRNRFGLAQATRTRP